MASPSELTYVHATCCIEWHAEYLNTSLTLGKHHNQSCIHLTWRNHSVGRSAQITGTDYQRPAHSWGELRGVKIAPVGAVARDSQFVFL